LTPRIHITGASGSGATTLGAGLAAALRVPWHDTDSYYWVATEPPFTTPRPMPERLDRLSRALDDEIG
jgi:adenylate kinase family enzyme